MSIVKSLTTTAPGGVFAALHPSLRALGELSESIYLLNRAYAISHGAVASAPLVGDHRCRALRNPRAADHAAAVQPTSNDRARDRTGDLRYGSHRWTDRVEGRTDRGAVAGRRPGARSVRHRSTTARRGCLDRSRPGRLEPLAAGAPDVEK
ncbi:hypothetical protein [Pseudonocardia dioxanivorans]|uniref:hypothetical protein n=1 Tax=Pseudonocardia dioxanivorans TaxID=240495 RepID=UPI0010516623|nr:hypothetical protein [Pseudonocardia dioxanivorans]